MTETKATSALSDAAKSLRDYLWQEICELPDRTSPEDYPDMGLVNLSELTAIVETYFEVHPELDRRASGQVEDMREALKPFADIASDYSDSEDDDFQVWTDFDVLGSSLPLKHFRAAAAALTTRRDSGQVEVKALSLDGFASDLKTAMQARSATVRGLGAELGVDKSAMSRARTGKALEARHFIALWNWLHFPALNTRSGEVGENE